MPNWCNNTIVIEGPAEKIRALWAAATTISEELGLLNALNPMPAELADTVADGSEGVNWYNWRVANWGTKWEVDMEGLQLLDVEDGRARIEGYADSAWGPPLEAFQAYANANDDVNMELKYFEPGMSFMGVWDTEGGDAYFDDVGDMLEITEEEDAVVYELLEHFDVWSWYDADEDDAAEEDDAADEDASKED
jgi:hypothetical protein